MYIVRGRGDHIQKKGKEGIMYNSEWKGGS